METPPPHSDSAPRKAKGGVRTPALELMLTDSVCQILDNLATLLQVRVVFFTADGKMLRKGANADNTPYCLLMQHELFGLATCEALDYAKRQECAARREVLHYVCHAGLDEIMAPVILYDELVGYITFGQFRTTHTPPECLTTEAQRQAFLNLPYRQSSEILPLCNLLTTLIDYMATKELINYARQLLYPRIVHYIEQNYSRDIGLEEMARHLGCSPSKIAHLLQQKHHTTFKKMLIARRLEEADKLLASTAMPLGAIAARVGVRRSYFYRLYRNRRGHSPSQVKKARE